MPYRQFVSFMHTCQHNCCFQGASQLLKLRFQVNCMFPFCNCKIYWLWYFMHIKSCHRNYSCSSLDVLLFLLSKSSFLSTGHCSSSPCFRWARVEYLLLVPLSEGIHTFTYSGGFTLNTLSSSKCQASWNVSFLCLTNGGLLKGWHSSFRKCETGWRNT